MKERCVTHMGKVFRCFAMDVKLLRWSKCWRLLVCNWDLRSIRKSLFGLLVLMCLSKAHAIRGIWRVTSRSRSSLIHIIILLMMLQMLVRAMQGPSPRRHLHPREPPRLFQAWKRRNDLQNPVRMTFPSIQRCTPGQGGRGIFDFQSPITSWWALATPKESSISLIVRSVNYG